MTELLGFLLLISPMVALTGVYVLLSCLFLKTCKACRLRMPRRATKCPWCHTFSAASHHPKKECV